MKLFGYRSAGITGLKLAVFLGACTPAVSVIPLAKAPRSTFPHIAKADAWDRAFTRRTGWTGGDVAQSVDLGDGRTLWLFGDSWIGSVVDGKHAAGSKMVSNVLAVHPNRKAPHALAPSSLKFAWNKANGGPEAWLRPTEKGSGNTELHYWFTRDGIVTRDRAGKRRLILFATKVAKNTKADSVWGFRSLGGVMVVVENHAAPLSAWSPQVTRLDADRGNPKSASDPPLLHWGIALLRHKGDIYIYGLQQAWQKQKNLVLARVNAHSLHDSKQWRFLTAGGWSTLANDLKPIAADISDELSVDWVTCGKRRELVVVHSEPMLGNGIMLRVAERPEGPFSVPRKIWTIPDTKRHETFFAAQARAHGHLSVGGRLLLSYVVNAHDFWLMAGDASIYRPRFVHYSHCQ